MPLGIHYFRVTGVDQAAGVLISDVVILGIGHLPLALGEVPDQAVVVATIPGAAGRVVATAHQRQFLFQQGIHLVLEGEHRWSHVAVFGAHGGKADGRVNGVGVGFVCQRQVEGGQPAGDVQQSIVGGAIVLAGVNAELAGPVQNGLIGRNQAETVQVIRVVAEGNRPLISATELGQHADHGVGGAVAEIGHPGLKRIETVNHPLDPAQRQHRFAEVSSAPAAPVVAVVLGSDGGRRIRRHGNRRPGVLVVVARRHPVIRHGQCRGSLDGDIGLSLAGGVDWIVEFLPGRHGSPFGRFIGSTGQGSPAGHRLIEPLEVEILRFAAKIAGVVQGQFFVKHAFRLDRLDHTPEHRSFYNPDNFKRYRQIPDNGIIRIVHGYDQVTLALGHAGGESVLFSDNGARRCDFPVSIHLQPQWYAPQRFPWIFAGLRISCL